MSRRSPRLQFTSEERAAPELKKAVKKADRRMDRLEKAEAKIPQKKVKTRVVDGKTGSITTRISFEEKKRPKSKLTHTLETAPGETVLAAVHREIRQSEEDNVGVESAHRLEETGEGVYRAGRSAYRSHQLKPYRRAERAEARADRANLSALNKEAQRQNPQLSSNPYSRWQQKRAIKKEYAAAKAGTGAKNTVKASETTAKAAKRAAEDSKKAATFVARHKKGFLAVAGIAAALLLLFTGMSSCSVLLQGAGGSAGAATYPAEDADILAAEAQYCGMEADLRQYLNTYESTHGYDEYHYELDEIQHDPYVLISALSALRGDEWTIDDVQDDLAMLFEKQYILTETVTTETRYYTETRYGSYPYTDPETGETVDVSYEYEVDVPYTYYICTVTLENFNLSHVPVYIMSQDQLSLYAMYMGTLGNRADLFPSSGYVGKYTGEYETYEIPAEALEDEHFAAIMTEAEKYLGYPYVWGGSSPSTSFDCSGFVSWVINHSGWDVGRLGSDSLYYLCTPVSKANARPGDLIFFERTYDTPMTSHVGIYVGDGMMIHCGDPIQYASIETSYWQSHFFGFGRLPNP